MSTTSWLSYLNTIQPENNQQQQNQQQAGGYLSDDLRAQLEAWTTVAFDEASFTSDIDTSSLLQSDSNSKPDPSPYAKRPFGQFQSSDQTQQQQPSLERGFNAFSTTSAPSSAFDPELFTNFGQIGVGVDGSNTLFPEPAGAGQQQQSLFNLNDVLLGQSTAPTSASTASTSTRPAKKQRTGSASASSTPAGDNPLSADSSSSAVASPTIAGTSTSSSTSNNAKTAAKQVLLSKAAILAAQAAELAAKKGETPEEEAARLAELNRIAAEDDKRRRNTAASARFRVKKKQRESALEDTVRELNGKLEKLEKELEATRVENNFLRELVIRKVGFADLPVASPGGAAGQKSGGQEGPTGMGTGSA